MSALTEKLIGLSVEDTPQSDDTLLWIQEQCRHGVLKAYIVEYIKANHDHAPVENTIVEEIKNDGIVCRIPSKIIDHENPKVFSYEIKLLLNPISGKVIRL